MPISYVVLGQRQFQDVNAMGEVVDAMEVTFQTGAGDTGRIVVPLAAYDPDVVRSMIEERAVRMEAVGRLEGTIE